MHQRTKPDSRQPVPHRGRSVQPGERIIPGSTLRRRDRPVQKWFTTGMPCRDAEAGHENEPDQAADRQRLPVTDQRRTTEPDNAIVNPSLTATTN